MSIGSAVAGMRAARLLPGADRLTIVDLPRPRPQAAQVLVEVAGAGLCRSDLHVLDGQWDHLVQRPVTCGHEITGRVAELGPMASHPAVGTPVAVMVGWGCGSCHWCERGHQQLCPAGREAGSTADGGFADIVLVPDGRFLIPLGGIDPIAATPLGCAALSAYAGVQRVLPSLQSGGPLVVIGCGGLGQFAVHYARRLGTAPVIAVDPRHSAREQALSLGAWQAIDNRADASRRIAELSAPTGASAVIDFVGSDQSLALAASVIGPRGCIALMGLGGGSLAFDFQALAPEATLTTVVAGTIADLTEVVRLAQDGLPAIPLTTYPLDRIDAAIDDLRAGRIEGRAVIVPGEH